MKLAALALDAATLAALTVSWEPVGAIAFPDETQDSPRATDPCRTNGAGPDTGEPLDLLAGNHSEGPSRG